MTAHRAVPRTDTAYTIGGPRDGKPLDMRFNATCWPASAHCAGCGEIIEREAVEEPWKHTGRQPGEPLG